ncbi:hypothetical protein FB451DRAFT_1516048 [Mycena latifolia]|nr:hypothetical protein FB451DRAFT_1516048 [Mycena latifolia]
MPNESRKFVAKHVAYSTHCRLKHTQYTHEIVHAEIYVFVPSIDTLMCARNSWNALLSFGGARMSITGWMENGAGGRTTGVVDEDKTRSASKGGAGVAWRGCKRSGKDILRVCARAVEKQDEELGLQQNKRKARGSVSIEDGGGIGHAGSERGGHEEVDERADVEGGCTHNVRIHRRDARLRTLILMWGWEKKSDEPGSSRKLLRAPSPARPPTLASRPYTKPIRVSRRTPSGVAHRNNPCALYHRWSTGLATAVSFRHTHPHCDGPQAGSPELFLGLNLVFPTKYYTLPSGRPTLWHRPNEYDSSPQAVCLRTSPKAMKDPPRRFEPCKYVSDAQKYDTALVDSWMSDMAGMLLFSHKTLNTDSGDMPVILLAQTSQQLAATPNGRSFSALSSAVFVPPGTSPSCNALYCENFYTEQTWLRGCHPRAHVLIPVFGLERFNAPMVVEVIPLLLRASRFFFFAGLVVFLMPVNNVVVAISSVLLAQSSASTSASPPFLYSPCRTPLSRAFWLLRTLSAHRGLSPPSENSLGEPVSVVEAMFRAATSVSKDSGLSRAYSGPPSRWPPNPCRRTT